LPGRLSIQSINITFERNLTPPHSFPFFQTNLADILNEVSPPSSTEKSSTGRPTSPSLATPETTRSGGDDDGDGGGRNKNGRRRDGGGRKRKNKNRKEQQLTIDRVQGEK
jgi:hypothetical protein